MARRDKRHPALRGYQVRRWLEKGILKAAQLGDTAILVVLESCRVRLTQKWRTTLSQGIFLVPRWIPIPEAEWRKISHLSEEELRKRGVIKKGVWPNLLIFQQVGDVDRLFRQQIHILEEEEKAGRRYFEEYIRPYIDTRKQVARSLGQLRRQQLEAIRNAKIAPLGKRLHHPELMTPAAIEEAVAQLDKIIAELEAIVEQPLVTRRKRAQRSLRAAQQWIRKGNLSLARERLRTAWRNLTWPV